MPDVMTLAKGLGRRRADRRLPGPGAAAEVFKPGNHGSTFGGNPLACAAALATLEAIEAGKTARQCASSVGESIRAGLRSALAGVQGVVDIRGRA